MNEAEAGIDRKSHQFDKYTINHRCHKVKAKVIILGKVGGGA